MITCLTKILCPFYKDTTSYNYAVSKVSRDFSMSVRHWCFCFSDGIVVLSIISFVIALCLGSPQLFIILIARLLQYEYICRWTSPNLKNNLISTNIITYRDFWTFRIWIGKNYWWPINKRSRILVFYTIKFMKICVVYLQISANIRYVET